jgi:hypothetical protein
MTEEKDLRLTCPGLEPGFSILLFIFIHIGTQSELPTRSVRGLHRHDDEYRLFEVNKDSPREAHQID